MNLIKKYRWFILILIVFILSLILSLYNHCEVTSKVLELIIGIYTGLFMFFLTSDLSKIKDRKYIIDKIIFELEDTIDVLPELISVAYGLEKACLENIKNDRHPEYVGTNIFIGEIRYDDLYISHKTLKIEIDCNEIRSILSNDELKVIKKYIHIIEDRLITKSINHKIKEWNDCVKYC